MTRADLEKKERFWRMAVIVWYVVGYFGVALMIYDILTGKFL